MQGAQHRKVDVALAVYRIIIGILGDGRRRVTGGGSRKVEELCDLWILALHADVEFICWLGGDHRTFQID